MTNSKIEQLFSRKSYNTYEQDKVMLDSISNEYKPVENNYSEVAIKFANDILFGVYKKIISEDTIKTKIEESVKEYIPYSYDLYFNNIRPNIRLGSHSGYIDNYSGEGLRFSTSLKDKAKMLVIPIYKITNELKNNNFISYTIQFNITGKFNLKEVYNNSSKKVNENNIIYAGFKYCNKYWLIERGPRRNNFNWHYGTLQDDNLQLPNNEDIYEQLHKGGGIYDTLIVDIDVNIKTKTVILRAINGDSIVEWIVPDSIIPVNTNKLDFILYRNDINDEYEINDIKCKITKIVDNTVDNTIDNTVDNTVDNTIDNTVDNNIDENINIENVDEVINEEYDVSESKIEKNKYNSVIICKKLL